ncbi:hypothetical protein SBBP2_1550012 [Burkholderiales bacterium]|nr:hypothetical protein SBBP2_1550012 [Burkholderiales bacterium]
MWGTTRHSQGFLSAVQDVKRFAAIAPRQHASKRLWTRGSKWGRMMEHSVSASTKGSK